MKFIYKLDSITTLKSASNESYEMDYEDLVPSVDFSSEYSRASLVERTNYGHGVMTHMSTHPTLPSEEENGALANLKVLDTEEVASAYGHYTLEDFFSNYGEIHRNESVDDISETDLDFSKLFVSFEEPPENPFQSLIDLVKCEIPKDLCKVDERFPKENVVEVKFESKPQEASPCKLIVKAEVVPPKPKPKHKKKSKSSLRPHSNGGSKLVEKREYVNSRKIDYGANDTIDNIYDLEWHPGFTRHLGAKGRSALLELVRRVYRQDPEHYKAILQSRNSPSSISSLPFYSIPMLWELAHQFGIFKQALTVYKNHCFAKSKANRNYGFGRSSQTSASSDSSENLDSDSQTKRVYSSQGSGDTINIPVTTMSGRLVKKSKKMLESNPEILENLSPVPNKAQLDNKSNLGGAVLKSAQNKDRRGESSSSLDSSSDDVKTESSENGVETKMWKLNVTNRQTNCVDEFKDAPLTPSHSLNRRISV